MVPTMRVAELAALNGLITDIILQFKSAYEDPLIVVAGDMNRRNLGDGMVDYQDMREVDHAPTRGGEKLDLIFCNVPEESTWAEVLEPLETEQGVQSDHNTVALAFKIRKARTFTWTRTRVRMRSEEGFKRFGELLKDMDWNTFFKGCRDPTSMVGEYQRITEELSLIHI